MEAFDEHMAKQLPNFTRFAEQFTKVFIPIIDTAINMSSNEPVSAYSVFKAAKEMAGTGKKSKKKQNATKKKDNCKGAKKGAGDTKKLTDKPAGVDATKPVKNNNKTTVIDAANVTSASAVNKTKSQSLENKKANTGGKGLNEGGNSANVKEINATDIEHKEASDADVKGYEIITLRDKLYPSNEKTLSKRNLKIREEFKDYVVIQVRGQKNLLGEDEDSFSSEGSEEELDEREAGYSNSYDFSNLILSESGSFSEEDHNAQTDSYSDEQSLSTNEEDNQAAAFVPPIMLSKANKKRKSTDTAKDKSKDTLVNSAVETKKPKRVEETAKPASRKSLPSSAVVEESSKNSLTSKTSNKIANVKLEPLLPPSNVVKVNSIEEGKRAFKWLLNPVPVDVFFSKYWERAACLIKRQQDNYFTHLISFEAIDKMLLKNHVEFTRNIDVTSYQNGVRQTLNPEGRALPPVVWDHYGQGCSIRLLNPQTFLPGLFSLSTTMQEYFHCLVGANAYLTPPNSQGFAPHYDDIEAFVLQIEGRKRWKLYKPRRRTEVLPRYSSKNFEQQEIGKPVLEEVLEPGDVLYFPRGTIHQACTEPGYHSLHITLSVYQRQSFADLFETMLPMMLQKAITSNVNLRKGLPLNAWQNAGIAFSENNTKERTVLIKQVNQLLQKSLREMPLKSVMDAAMDQLAKKFQHEALPPEILPAEKLRTVFGSRSRANERGECICDYDIDERTNVRLLRANILRLVEEEGKLRIYYYLDNSKVYCEYEPNFIEIDKFEAASVEVLIKSYPQYVGVSQLPLPSDEQKITLVLALWERGLLMMEKPFK